MNEIILKGAIFIFYASIFIGYVVLFYYLFRVFNLVICAILKQAKIIKFVIQFFYYREDFFDYLKDKEL